MSELKILYVHEAFIKGQTQAVLRHIGETAGVSNVYHTASGTHLQLNSCATRGMCFRYNIAWVIKIGP